MRTLQTIKISFSDKGKEEAATKNETPNQIKVTFTFIKIKLIADGDVSHFSAHRHTHTNDERNDQ